VASARVKATRASCRAVTLAADGHTHCTLSGVSPQPAARRPARSETSSRTRAQVTDVSVSAPNFNGTRVSTGSR